MIETELGQIIRGRFVQNKHSHFKINTSKLDHYFNLRIPVSFSIPKYVSKHDNLSLLATIGIPVTGMRGVTRVTVGTMLLIGMLKDFLFTKMYKVKTLNNSSI